MVRFCTAWIAAFFLVFFLSPSTQVDTMTPSNPLADGQTLVSAGGRFGLGFFSPTDSQKRYLGIWHDDVPIQTVVWVANRENPILDSTTTLVLDDSGRLVVSAGRNSTVVWSSPTAMKIDSPVAQLLDSGNLVVRDAAGAVFAWQSFDHPTDTLLPGMKLGFDLAAGLNRSLSAWKKDADPSSAAFSVVLESGVEPQIVLQASSDQLWRSGPWNGLGFSGMPEMKGFIFTLVNTETEVYFMYHSNESIITNLVLQPSGSINLRVWDPQTGNWNLSWYAPENQCDALAPCGPNGVCNADSSPVCSCLMGFTPRVPASWALRDGTDGCVRQTKPDCTSDSTRFTIMRNMKLPDTAGLRRDMVITFLECRAICQFNCSCYAYASADIRGDGQGCMIWNSGLIGLQVLPVGGQDLYLRLDNTKLNQTQSDTGGGSGGMRPIAIIIGTVTFGTLVISLVGCIIWRKKRKTKDSMHNKYNDEITQEEDLDLPMLDLKTIVIATDNFSIENKLGEGGFGLVYKGRLGEGQDIAVKRLSKSSIQGAREFKNEVILIARLQHRNLVRLLGCCIQGEEKILVYEYMPNKSLDSFLFDKTNDSLAAWDLRYNIILGIARGLLYLHQDSRFRIIHRDLKASNILLDKVMNPKISDFGMARIFGGDENEASTRRVVGTYGYMAPEYIMEGIFSVKSDVFSFGVLLLEIISGKRNRGNEFSENHGNLLGYAWNFWREGSGLELVDRSMECSYPTTKVLRCINIGLLCVQERPEDRPTMSSIVLMLSSDDGVLPHPKRPGFVLTGAPSESCNLRKEICSLNDVTLTFLDGR